MIDSYFFNAKDAKDFAKVREGVASFARLCEYPGGLCVKIS